MRIDRFLANSGVATRSTVRKIIKEKRVEVNGNIISDIAYKVDEFNDKILFDGKVINYKKNIYIMMNKPSGYISATYDNYHKTVLDLLEDKYSLFNLFPIGRLDIDTEGLIILTTDGNLSHSLLSPKKHIPKVYYVELEYELENDGILRIENGIDIGGYVTKNDTKIEQLSLNTCYITITEGKFHQIKKMFLAINNKVKYLKRVKMNKLELDKELKLGEYRELHSYELELLKD